MIDSAILIEAYERAQKKLEWIISREGDADGERLKDYYFNHLVAEFVSMMLLEAKCQFADER